VTLYKANIIGLGNIAWKFQTNAASKSFPLTHAACFEANPKTTLVGGTSPDIEDRNKFQEYSNLPTFGSAEEMIQQTKPDIVSICSPPESHYHDIQLCLKCKVPMIWLEKPPLKTLQELDQCISLQKQSNSTVLVNYMRRYSNCYKSMKDLFLQNKLGQPQSIVFNYSQGLESNGIHLIDLLAFILDDPTQRPSIQIFSNPDSQNPSFTLSLGHEVDFIFLGTELPYHTTDVTLTCEKGRASINAGGMEAKVELVTPNKTFPGFFHLTPAKDNLLGVGDVKDTLAVALDNLIHAYENNYSPGSNLKTARFATNVVESIRQDSGS
jgi:predicted dehydrogenase